MSAIDQLRALDGEIVQHVIARGKLWEKRRRIVQKLRDEPELADYQAELKEWLSEMTTDIEGGN